MSVFKEGGYVQQVQNFELLIQLVQQVGSAYNPANEKLSLLNLMNLHVQAKTSLNEWVSAYVEFERMSSLRKEELNNLFLFVTCLSREVKACGIGGEILNDILSLVRQFRGQRISAQLIVLDQAVPITQQRKSGINYSCERKFELFYQLVNFLEQTSEYVSNSPDLNPAGLREKVAQLKQLQNNYLESLMRLEASKAKRNKYIMSDLLSIAYYSKLVKAYLRNVYKGSKSELKTLSAIKFRSATP